MRGKGEAGRGVAIVALHPTETVGMLETVGEAPVVPKAERE